MTWYCVDLSANSIAEGLYHRLCREFQKSFIAAGAPAEMALFAQTVPNEGCRKVYFSPGSVHYVNSLIELLSGAPCDEPDQDLITLVFGVPDAGAKLFASTRVLDEQMPEGDWPPLLTRMDGHKKPRTVSTGV